MENTFENKEDVTVEIVEEKTSIITKLKQKYRKLPNRHKKALFGYIFILPFIIGTLFFGVSQIWDAIKMALSDKAGYEVSNGALEFMIHNFGSFAQFKEIFLNQPEHVEIIIDVLSNVLVVVPLVLVFSLIISLLLNNPLKGMKFFRVVFFIPVILLSGNLLNYLQDYDLLSVPILNNSTIIDTIQFYIPAQFTSIIFAAFDQIVLILWLCGVQTLIFLAGLQKTNKPIYEAASIDGASGWEIFWKITFPSLIPLMMINIVYTTVVYSGLGNDLVALIFETRTKMEFGYDYASALGWVLFGIELLVIGIYIFILSLLNKNYE